MKRFFLPGLGGAMLLLMLPSLQAQTCSGNGDVVGAYGFAASRLFSAVPATAPGTNGTSNTGTSTTPTVSNSDFGRFLGGVSGQTPFGTVGRLVADGSGNFFATASATTGSPVQVGTYTVNSDCTISASFTDAFVNLPVTPPGTASSGGTTTTAVTPVTATFEGVVLNHGNDVELVQTGSSATGAVVEMRHTLQFNGCTNASLTGGFGVVSEATMASTTGTPAAVPLFGRLVSNGDGTFGLDALGQKSALPGRQLTGTYTVNPDCTGTAQVVTSDGATRNLNFVIVRSDVGACQSGGSVQPELLFGFTDQGVSGIGFSR